MEKTKKVDYEAALELDPDEDGPSSKRKRVDTYYDDHDMKGYTALVEKDELTLMVRSLHPRTGEFELFELFSKVGRVNDVKLVRDPRSNKNIGVAYVEMQSVADVEKGLALSGEELSGTSIVVQRSMALKNRMASMGASASAIKQAGTQLEDPRHASAIAASAHSDVARIGSAGGGLVPPPPPAGGPGGGGRAEPGIKVYVGGLDFSFDEGMIQEIFQAFGELEAVHLQRDINTQTSKGFAFVHFKRVADGTRCCEQMDGSTIAGRQIKVNVAGTQGAHQQAQPQLPPALNAAAAAAAGYTGDRVISSGAGGGSGGFPQMNGGGDQISSLDGLDDAAGRGGISERLGASQRASLLMKLAHNAGIEVPDATRKVAAQSNSYGSFAGTSQGPSYGNHGADSRCVVLKNMFDRLSDEAQSNPNYFTELADDVRGECARLGTVLFAAADKVGESQSSSSSSTPFPPLLSPTHLLHARTFPTHLLHSPSPRTFSSHLSSSHLSRPPPSISPPSVVQRFRLREDARKLGGGAGDRGDARPLLCQAEDPRLQHRRADARQEIQDRKDDLTRPSHMDADRADACVAERMLTTD